MPGFPDKFMPFMEAPVAGVVPSGGGYAPVIRTLRGFTLRMTAPANSGQADAVGRR
jgi:hydrogenase small subunit